MTSSSFTNQIKNVPFFNGANAEFPKFTRDMVTFAKQHGLYKAFAEEVEIPDANEEKCSNTSSSPGKSSLVP